MAGAGGGAELDPDGFSSELSLPTWPCCFSKSPSAVARATLISYGMSWSISPTCSSLGRLPFESCSGSGLRDRFFEGSARTGDAWGGTLEAA